MRAMLKHFLRVIFFPSLDCPKLAETKKRLRAAFDEANRTTDRRRASLRKLRGT